MADALKHNLGPDVVRWLAQVLRDVPERRFDAEAFQAEALAGLDELEFSARARHLSVGLRRHLDPDVEVALGHLEAALGEELGPMGSNGLSVFRYWPMVVFVADYGLDHFEAAMAFQHAVTRRFTAEFSLGRFVERDPERTLKVLERWTQDPSEHVRRLVSEGTRPRLPWAPRLRTFEADPSPVLALLERLRDDPSDYVRRSVANHLNDVSKDHPEVVVELCKRWSAGGSPERKALVRHGLRTLLKAGHPGALAVVGAGEAPALGSVEVRMEPPVGIIGESSTIVAELEGGEARQELLVDFVVWFARPSERPGRKVFRGKALTVGPREAITLRKALSLRQHSTRTHYPGEHRVEVMVNGVVVAEARFEVRER